MSLLVTKGVVKPSQRQLFVKKIALQLFSRQIIIFPKSNCPPEKKPPFFNFFYNEISILILKYAPPYQTSSYSRHWSVDK